MSYLVALILVSSSIHLPADMSTSEACMDVLANDVNDARLYTACTVIFEQENGYSYLSEE